MGKEDFPLQVYIRLLYLLLLWGGVFCFFLHTSRMSIFLFFCTSSLALYFMIPIIKKKWIPYWILSFSSAAALLLTEDMPFWIFVAIAFFYVFEAGRDLMPANFRVLLISIFIFIGAIFYFHYSFFYWSIYIGISLNIFMVLFYCNSFQNELFYQRDLYDQLLDEYRKLKRLALENERTARLEERTRIAREMHDSVGHKLTVLNMQIGMMLAENKTDLLLQMKEIVEDSLKETRRAVRALETDEIEGISSVIHLIRKLEAESHLRVHFTTKQGVLGVSLSNQHSVVLYRVIQEALTNAMKHAFSKEVYVTLGVSPIGQLTLEIKNKIHSHKPFHEGFGLRNIKERMIEIGGKITIFQTDNHFIIQGTMPREGEDHDSNFVG